MNTNLINELIELQEDLGRARNTIVAMRNSYNRLSGYMSFDIDGLKAIDKKKAQKIIIQLSKNFSNSTIKLTRTYINELYNYAEINSPFKSVKLPTQKKNDKKDKFDFFTIEQAKAILSRAQNQINKHARRDYAIIQLMLNAGLRKSEVIGLDVKDVNLENNTITLFDTKREDQVTVDISQKTIDLIKDYLYNREGSYESLFISSYKCRLSESGIDRVVNKILGDLGYNGSPHTLRHTTASLMADRGMTAIDIQTRLRHSSLTTTMKYIGQSRDRQSTVASELDF